MNRVEADILKVLLQESFVNQRILAEMSGHSLGIVNRSVKNLINEGFLDKYINLTQKAYKQIEVKSPKNAIILAAGFGMRMIPINMQYPKALLEVNGVPLIERIIQQLHDVGIKEIHIVVGFMKEQFEYLIDDYGVDLIVNEEYAVKNNLHSLTLAADYLSNSYIVPCDIWFSQNPFSQNELYSWYMVSDLSDSNSTVRVNRKQELVKSQGGSHMVGIAYLTKKDSLSVRNKLIYFDKSRKYDEDFWEDALFDGDRMIVNAKLVSSSECIEINTYEQLREFDDKSTSLNSNAISVITSAFGVNNNEIVNIEVLKKGMTNRSFLFSCKGKRYIMRIPGEGTDQLIDRKKEADVYKVIADKNICDEILYINPNNGYKITAYLENSRVCDSLNQSDLIACMKCLKAFHNQKLEVQHEFDIFKQIDFYESLWNGQDSIYRDYKLTKKHVIALEDYIEKHIGKKVLTHIDAVPDNFLFTENGDIRLIDWEYAGMQDPHVDIAMFCIYALYDKKHIDNLIDIYFEGMCPQNIRLKIYCYIAVCGLLWSNWCEYKRNLGIEFGEYSLRQYRYAKDYYRIFMEEGGFSES